MYCCGGGAGLLCEVEGCDSLSSLTVRYGFPSLSTIGAPALSRELQTF